MACSLKSVSVLLLLTISARPQDRPADDIVATFEDSPPPAVAFIVDTPDPFLYKGLVWHGFSVIQSNHGSLARYPQSGYARGAVSGVFAVVAAGRAVRESTIEQYGGGAFVFHGAHLTAAWKTGLEVTVEGLRGGDVVFAEELLISTTKTVVLDNTWRIDMLRIRASGGSNEKVCPPAACQPGPELVIDDFTFSRTAVAPLQEKDVSGGEPLESPRVLEGIPANEKITSLETVAAPEAAKLPERSDAGLSLPPRPEACGYDPYYGVQLGTFAAESNARRLQSLLEQTYDVVRIYLRRHEKGRLHHLVIGCSETRNEVVQLFGTLLGEEEKGLVVRVSSEEFGEPL